VPPPIDLFYSYQAQGSRQILPTRKKLDAETTIWVRWTPDLISMATGMPTVFERKQVSQSSIQGSLG